TILYVLFILFVITLLATTITTIMLRNNRVSQNLSNARRAAYAAESGTERALYYLQYARSAKTVGVESAALSMSDFASTFATTEDYDVTATATDDNYAVDIAENASQQWDVFGEEYAGGDFHNSPTLAPLTNLKNIHISWNESTGCAAGNNVEIAFSSWTALTWEDISSPSSVQTRFILSCPHDASPSSTYDCDKLLGVDDTHLYKVWVKPLDCTIEDANMVAEDTSGTAIETHNLVTVTSIGEYAGSTRMQNSTTILWDPRLQRYFDFVVFSEQEIVK
ncbi:MAG: hypothetical protein ACD_43C00006G0001, partial [uncultured bacterium]